MTMRSRICVIQMPKRALSYALRPCSRPGGLDKALARVESAHLRTKSRAVRPSDLGLRRAG